MSILRKTFLITCVVFIIINIIRYFFYGADVIQTLLSIVSMTWLIISVLLNNEQKHEQANKNNSYDIIC